MDLIFCKWFLWFRIKFLIIKAYPLSKKAIFQTAGSDENVLWKMLDVSESGFHDDFNMFSEGAVVENCCEESE